MSDSSDEEEEEEQQQRRRQPNRRISRSERAGVIFPVGKIERSLRKLVKERLTAGAAVYLAGVFQSLTAEEIIECAGCIAYMHGDRRIKPRHIMLTIEGDDEFRELLGHVVIPTSGRPVGVLAPLHPPTSRLRLSKERRQKLEEADVRKFKARVRSKNNDAIEDYDTDEYPPTSDIDEERYFPEKYIMSSPKPWPLPKRNSNIASVGIKSGYQIHTKKKQRVPSPPEEDLSPSTSPSLPPPPSPPNHTPPNHSTPDFASRWKRGSSLQRTNKTGRKARERSLSERGNSQAGSSSSSDSDDEHNNGHNNKEGKQRRKPNVYEFKTVERKKPPISRPTGWRTTESDFEIGSHLRRSPVLDNTDYVFNNFDAGGDGNKYDDDDDELPDLPFFRQSTGSRQKELQTKEMKERIAIASRRRSSSIVSLESSPSLPSTDRGSSDLSVFSRLTKGRDNVNGRGPSFTDAHRRKSDGKGFEEKHERNGTKITRPSSRWDKDTSDDSDIVLQFKKSVISRSPLLPEVDKDISDASDSNTITQKSRKGSFASDKLPQDSVAFRKKQLLQRTMSETRRSRSTDPGDSQSYRRKLWDSGERIRKFKSYASNIRPARATARDVLALYKRGPEAETRRPSSHVSSIINPSSHPSSRKTSNSTNRDLSRLNTPSVPEMDLSQTTQGSISPESDMVEFEITPQNLSAENQALQRQRFRSASQKLKSLPSSRFRMPDSSSQQAQIDPAELENDKMELDDPDTDGTDGDDEKEAKALDGADEPDDVYSVYDVDDDTARRSSPELEEQPPSKRRPPSTTDVVAAAASLPLPSRKSALSTVQVRSQSVRSTTGLENESQIENGLYEADSIASAGAKEEIMQNTEDSNQRSSLPDNSRSGSSSRPAAKPVLTKTLSLPSSSLPRLLPLDADADSDIELLSTQSPRTASTPSSNQPRSRARIQSRASAATITVVDPNIVDISSGEEEDRYLNTKDDVIVVKEERPDNPATGSAHSQTSKRERGTEISASSLSNAGDKETQESVEI